VIDPETMAFIAGAFVGAGVLACLIVIARMALDAIAARVARVNQRPRLPAATARAIRRDRFTSRLPIERRAFLAARSEASL
jgi:hypothetical protein